MASGSMLQDGAKSESIETLTNVPAFDDTEDASDDGIWGAADQGDLDTVQRLLDQGIEVNCRNCLGCVPLMYAAGSGHLDVVTLLLSQPGVCVNIRNNDRLTCFMLAMQVGRDASSWTGSGQKKLKKMMDMPALSEVDWTRNDRVRLHYFHINTKINTFPVDSPHGGCKFWSDRSCVQIVVLAKY